MLRFLFFISVFYLIFAFYGFQAYRTILKSSWLQVLYWLFYVGILLNFFLATNAYTRTGPPSSYLAISGGVLLAFMVFGLFSGAIMLLEDIGRVIIWMYQKIGAGNTADSHLPSRRKFISLTALGLSAIPFSALLYGMYKGKYNFKIFTHTLYFEDLPDAFQGYKIAQISDIHSGSFDNFEQVNHAVELVNKQQADAIVFTGDIVNNIASELYPWKETFAKLSAKDGVYSILGNHDYGDYYNWNGDTKAKADNLEELKQIQKEMGFDLLLNESRYIEKNGTRIALVGVENWGAGGFKKAGDLNKAIKNINPNDFKILLSHDPSHWEFEVIDHPQHFHLTLSGHTHGMQFGVEIPGIIKWSPVKWRYKYWAGIYEKSGQYINVNRGLGYIGYPGRVGIWPEITVIELKKRKLG